MKQWQQIETMRLLLIVTVSVFIFNGCGKGQEDKTPNTPFSVTWMEAVTNSLDDLKLASPFRAQVAYIMVTNPPGGVTLIKGNTSGTTNFYILELQNLDGRSSVYSGRNARPQDIDVLRNLKVGSNYTFPKPFTQ